jgi:2-polyprenyl-3-methyl-5-hydroxy-6-metoxy-1,4-benzoquinol methylase
MWESGSRKTVLPLFARLVAPDSGPVLDAGCDDGYASLKLARQGYRVQGVDISDDMIQLANRQAAGVNGRYLSNR